MEGVVKYKKETGEFWRENIGGKILAGNLTSTEWSHLSRKARFFNIFAAVVQQQSKKVAFLFFFVNHLVYASECCPSTSL